MKHFGENAFCSCHCKAVMLSQNRNKFISIEENHIFYDRVFYLFLLTFNVTEFPSKGLRWPETI